MLQLHKGAAKISYVVTLAQVMRQSKKSQKKSKAIQWAGFFATMYKLLVSPVQRWLHMRLPSRQLAI